MLISCVAWSTTCLSQPYDTHKAHTNTHKGDHEHAGEESQKTENKKKNRHAPKHRTQTRVHFTCPAQHPPSLTHPFTFSRASLVSRASHISRAYNGEVHPASGKVVLQRQTRLIGGASDLNQQHGLAQQTHAHQRTLKQAVGSVLGAEKRREKGEEGQRGRAKTKSDVKIKTNKVFFKIFLTKKNAKTDKKDIPYDHYREVHTCSFGSVVVIGWLVVWWLVFIGGVVAAVGGHLVVLGLELLVGVEGGHAQPHLHRLHVGAESRRLGLVLGPQQLDGRVRTRGQR